MILLRLLPRIVLVNAERANGRWHWTVGLYWPCGCQVGGTSYTPLGALRMAERAHRHGERYPWAA